MFEKNFYDINTIKDMTSRLCIRFLCLKATHHFIRDSIRVFSSVQPKTIHPVIELGSFDQNLSSHCERWQPILLDMVANGGNAEARIGTQPLKVEKLVLQENPRFYNLIWYVHTELCRTAPLLF